MSIIHIIFFNTTHNEDHMLTTLKLYVNKKVSINIIKIIIVN